MKATLFLIALATGGAALAQSEMQTTTNAGGQMSAPGNSAPERDARGIPVISDPAMVPPGWNEAPRPGGTGAPPSATPAPMGAGEAAPPCSRTVTDNCTQTYEGGGSRRRRR